MEVRVQGDDDLAVLAGVTEDGSVICVSKTYVSDVFGFETRVTQTGYGSAWKALIKKQHQRALTGGRILSSR